VTVTSLGGGRYELVSDSGRTLVYGVRLRNATWVFLDGRVFVIRMDEAQDSGARPHDDAALGAPMPATVVAINVAPGQEVKAGDALIVLEAMKMELAVTAPKDGRVRRVACRVGELVQPGVPLVEFDESPM
jgi:3-methylcrotonyl-CoA carboxylase alpha subunit